MCPNFLAWFRPAPHTPRLPAAEIARLYPKYRWRIFESAFLAYATFYIVRNNFAPVSKEMGAALHYDKDMIGTILLATSAPVGLSARYILPGRVLSLFQRDAIVVARVDCGIELSVHLTLGELVVGM